MEWIDIFKFQLFLTRTALIRTLPNPIIMIIRTALYGFLYGIGIPTNIVILTFIKTLIRTLIFYLI